MIPAEYLDQVKVRLLTDTLVAEFEIRRERSTGTTRRIFPGCLGFRITFTTDARSRSRRVSR
ncbi:MAG: hypothetical protein KIT77_09960 [Caldilinea sp.]|nr:hypothetical protein [Caldilinea sp.]